jgi:hypothetical protein
MICGGSEMKASQEAIELLQQRLKNVGNSTDSKELEELANAVAAIAKLETTDDILGISDAKLAELLAFANAKITEIDEFGAAKQDDLLGAKDGDLAEIAASKQGGLEAIQEQSEAGQDELNTVVDDFATMDDVPENSTILATIRDTTALYDFLQPADLPFIFGILSRYNDYYGIGNFTTELGYWYNSNANTMLSLLAGCHNYANEYAAFYLEPKLCFLQGLHGNFNKKKSYVKYSGSSSQYSYPYAALGCLFVKNTTAEAITSALNFGGSSHSASYAGASMFVGVPKHENSTVTWTNVYSHTEAASGFSNSASVTVPANSTVAVIFYTSSYVISSSTTYNYFSQFINWRLDSVRSGFLVDGLEIDLERTLKAWQCPGFSTTYQLFE